MTTLALSLAPNRSLLAGGLSDDQLVHAARQGRAEAFDALLSRHHQTARAIAGRILHRDAAGLEDVLAEAACRAWVHLPRLRDGVRFRSWYCTIVRNAALDFAYKVGRERGPAGHDDSEELSEFWWDRLESQSLSPMESLEQTETLSLLQQALGDLEPLYAIPVRRRCLDEASYQEIARELDKPVGTVKSLVHRGKALIEQRLREQHVLL